ncbi:Crp/Fnr family transcriptional regulator [Sandaracinus amylolyticus]|uniref:Transcriptional regulator, Crp/Fnr family protein n=1 Tax=Sandaracinus amylolyticus TaxID=927083 RepID=A0A0F6YFA7_9BACT|nr:Crp/Fnr family transcriptional regulator [Sandaracinus amylolyticus]AKF03428.1 transcriptional regulator, Crp/Fnr family protein [Sandaracinus amylolyticus]
MDRTEVHVQRESLLRTLSTSRLFRTLDPALLAALVPHASVHRLQQGESLWRRGTPAEHFHVVLRGVLELQRAPGTESTLIALFGPGESPAIPVTLERRAFIADAYAATPSVEVLRVSAAPILELVQTDVRLALAINRALLEHCALLHAKIDVLASGTVLRRVAAFMLDLAERFGDEGIDGKTYVPLALSRAHVATYVGARVETVIRIFSQWHKDGLVATTKDGFVIRSTDELRALRGAGGADEEDGTVSS